MSEPEVPTPEEAHHFLKDDNERRCTELLERTQGRINLNGAWESMRATTYLKHLCVEMGVLDRADLDFEGQRSTALDKIEEEVTQHEAALAKAQAQAKLMGKLPGHLDGAAGPRLLRPPSGA
jgi:hypothetical protein